MGWKLKITHRITRGNSNNQKMNIYEHLCKNTHGQNTRHIEFIWVNTA